MIVTQIHRIFSLKWDLILIENHSKGKNYFLIYTWMEYFPVSLQIPPPPLRYDGKITDRPVLPSLLYNDKIVI